MTWFGGTFAVKSSIQASYEPKYLQSCVDREGSPGWARLSGGVFGPVSIIGFRVG